jgi:bacteriorhodopsin
MRRLDLSATFVGVGGLGVAIVEAETWMRGLLALAIAVSAGALFLRIRPAFGRGHSERSKPPSQQPPPSTAIP